MHNNENIDELSYVIKIVQLFILCHPNFYQYHECSLQLSTVNISKCFKAFTM